MYKSYARIGCDADWVTVCCGTGWPFTVTSTTRLDDLSDAISDIFNGTQRSAPRRALLGGDSLEIVGFDPSRPIYFDHDLNGTKEGTGWVKSDDGFLDRNGNGVIDGGAGDDQLIGGGRDDGLFGGIGKDKLWGDDATEAELSGQSHGSDYLDGGADDDQLIGGGKDDFLYGRDGADLMWGDAENEADLAGQYHGNDYLDGGDGIDIVFDSDSWAANDFEWRLAA